MFSFLLSRVPFFTWLLASALSGIPTILYLFFISLALGASAQGRKYMGTGSLKTQGGCFVAVLVESYLAFVAL